MNSETRRMIWPLLLAMSVASAANAQVGAAARRDALKDLPLREIPAVKRPEPVFAIFLTGDGGWSPIDNDITAELASHGVNVIGLDSRAYLHERRTPDQVAADLNRVIRRYRDQWHTDRFVLAGYSRGADLSPFIVSRLDSTLRKDIALVAMFGLSTRAGFEFHFEDIFRDVKRSTDQPTLPELEKLRGLPMLCVYGEYEKESGCRDAPDSLIQRIQRPGTHHFDRNYKGLADLILSALKIAL